MRKIAISLAAAITACGGSAAKRDSVARDSAAAAVAPAPVDSASAPAAGTASTVSATKAITPSSSKTIAPPNGSGPQATNAKPDTRPHTTPARMIALDTIRGIVSVTGTDRDHHVKIAQADGGARIEVMGDVAALVGHQAGADVWVSGVVSGTTIQAERFIVRTVEGMPAIDGTLHSEGGNVFIVTAGGTRTKINAPPPPLVGHDGDRVWITGDPARGVASFGRIDPPR